MGQPKLALAILALTTITGVLAQPTWCGKNYQSTQPITIPGGNFPLPITSTSPLLSLRCSQSIRPYLASDIPTPGGIIISTQLGYTQTVGAEPISLSGVGEGLWVTVSDVEGGKVLTEGYVPLNSTKFEIPFDLSALEPRLTPYNISCAATYPSSSSSPQAFTTTSTLTYLPDNPSGTVTKIDQRTGALLVKPMNAASSPSAEWESVFPIGFYTLWDGFLNGNLSALDGIKDAGYTVVHPVPPYDNVTAFEMVLDKMEELGLWLMYDMRWTYTNLTNVTTQVSTYSNRTNLLLWYTADEPDGWGDPLNATTLAYEAIREVDPYHPVALVLNCQDYYFWDYAAGADILMQDTYMIGINATWSNTWNTPCTPDYGDCGCDNCVGEYEDISNRMDEFAYRLNYLGWELDKSVWTVPQAFGNDEYWTRTPTGPEFLVQSILAINHGARGVIPWDYPTTSPINSSASLLSYALPTLKNFMLNPASTFENYNISRVDVGVWRLGEQSLVLGTNLNYEEVGVGFWEVGVWGEGVEVFGSGVEVGDGVFEFGSVGSGAWIFG
ncbi:hypothetical protein JAAARDRAFT_158780 [Jaapia argillacea MUCL 33604]|uniref:Glycoside hydrolase family 18 protein n=1 Tax=Jaapia argillacea MUCL 33604 TaxID=933084 RepID=A0A067PQC2_9AGAM|nr:hypothetical protein JAAARDRAFT_158780 [Jaapia argillacea MUCL 33604]